MAHYKVISSALAEFKQGEVVTDDDLSGLNVTALILGGHLDTVTQTAKTTKHDEAKEK
jgi:hypothetical protein